MAKILLTGFKSEKTPNSTEVLLCELKRKAIFLFSNDYVKIREEISRIVEKETYDTILMFGQKPLIKRLSLEKIGKSKEEILETNFPLELFIKKLKKYSIAYKISENPGTSYCNFAYYNMLRFLKEQNKNTKVLFIHIPYLENFLEMDKVITFLNNIEEME